MTVIFFLARYACSMEVSIPPDTLLLKLEHATGWPAGKVSSRHIR